MGLLQRLIGRRGSAPQESQPPEIATPAQLRERLREAQAALRASDAARALGLAEGVLGQPVTGDELRSDALAVAVNALHATSRYEDALARARDLAALRPSPESSVLLAQELHFCGRSGEALEVLDAVAASQPAHADAWRGRGHVLLALGRAREAADAFERVMQIVGATPEGLVNRAGALQRLGEAPAALRDLETALRANPGDRRAQVNRIGVLMDLMRLDEARDAAQEALRRYPDDPELHWNLGLVLLLQGELRQGWVEHEWRSRVPAFRAKMTDLPQPEWKGQDVRGRTLLVLAEQGFGDTLQFARYLPLLEAKGARVLLLAPDTLKPLLATLSPNIAVSSRLQDLRPFDYQCSMMSLPGVFGTTLESIPANVPYVRADPERRQHWARRLGERRGLRVGVVWSGNPAQQNDHNRSMALATFSAIATEGCEFVVLQNAVRPQDEAALAAWKGLRFFGEEIASFADTAALAEEMDLVVSVCTSGAHLAGALGRPLWVLLAFNADWRWLVGRGDSPWYPTARLFRQPRSGAWDPVIARVRSELARLAAGTPATDAAPQAEAAAERLRQGNAALGAGDLAAAVALYREAAALAPQDPAAHVNLGYALLEQGQPEAARQVLQKAAALDGGPDAHYLLGQAHAAQGDWAAARDAHLAALMDRHDFGFAWRDLGVAEEHLGAPAAALQAYEEAVRHAPELLDALAACARLQLEAGDAQQALAWAQRWVASAPGDWQALFTEGQALFALGRSGDALSCLDRAAAASPGHPAVAHARGNALFQMERFEEAACSYAIAAEGAPDWIQAHLNRGVALDRIGSHAEALACFERVLALEPAHPAALYHRPIVLISLGRVAEALQAVAEARRLRPDDPDMEWHYAFAHLLAGRMEEGWPAYEARWRASNTGAPLVQQAFPQPLWRGQPLSGKTILLYPEQGLGDMLQFARFVPQLEARGARVLLWAPASLQALLATVSPHVVVEARVQDLPAFDYQCPIMSLPLGLGTTLTNLPATVPYLHSDAQRRKHWAEKLGDRRGLRVGIVWSGNAAQQNDHRRSMALATFAQIATPGCEFVALQNAIRREDEMALAAWEGLRFFGDEIQTFADTAALAEEMDLVVSVCTSGAHLAGALGRPLWVLLSYRADWRWLLEREDSPWYPTARLFRQPAAGEWQPVLARVRSELEALAQRAA